MRRTEHEALSQFFFGNPRRSVEVPFWYSHWGGGHVEFLGLDFLWGFLCLGHDDQRA